MERKKYYALDIAKFISAFLVVCIHTGPLLDVNREANFVLVQILARLAVPFFFVASGFLFFQKIDFKRESNDYENLHALRHYVGRLLKIYVLWSLLYLPFTYLLWHGAGGISVHNFLLYIRDFFFTGSYYHLWFLPALMLAVPIVYGLIFRWGIWKSLGIGMLLYLLGMAGNVYGDVLSQVPFLKQGFAMYQSIFVTTRNGLFFGPVFIVLGAIFAKRNFYLKNYQAMTGLLVSLVALFGECFALRKAGFMHDVTSMYLLLVPCMYFFFLLLLRVHLKPRKVYKTLRILSLLIYVSHLMPVTLLLLAAPQMHSLLVYGLAMVITLLGSCVLILLSKKLTFLRQLYT